jgi:predicted SnoaL-like aldol condensation-catalyzing enzyme
MEFPRPAKPIEMRSIDIWRTENGKFVEHWDELNYLVWSRPIWRRAKTAEATGAVSTS